MQREGPNVRVGSEMQSLVPERRGSQFRELGNLLPKNRSETEGMVGVSNAGLHDQVGAERTTVVL